MAEPGCLWCEERAVATWAGDTEEGGQAVTASTGPPLGTQALLQRRLHRGSQESLPGEAAASLQALCYCFPHLINHV